MNISGVLEFEYDEELDWWISDLVPVPALDGADCSIIIEGYNDDPAKDELVEAARNFLSIGRTALEAAAPHVFEYYKDCNDRLNPGDPGHVVIASPDEVWGHVRFGFEAHVSRRGQGGRGVYVSLACNCDWEPEHGLQLVFRNGLVINKIGEFDGHLTNSDAFGDKELENVVYHSHRHK